MGAFIPGDYSLSDTQESTAASLRRMYNHKTWQVMTDMNPSLAIMKYVESTGIRGTNKWSYA